MSFLSPYPEQLDFHWPFPEKKSFFYRLKSIVTVTFVYVISKAVFCGIYLLVYIKNKKYC